MSGEEEGVIVGNPLGNANETKLRRQQSSLVYPPQYPGYPFTQNTHNDNSSNPALHNNLGVIPDSLTKIKDPLSSLTEKLIKLEYEGHKTLANAPKTKTQNTQTAYKALLESFIKNKIGKIPIQPWDTGYKDVNNYINSIWDQFGESVEFSQDALKEINSTIESLKQDFAKNEDKDDILKSSNKNKDVIENLIKDPDKHKKNIISACDKITDGMVSTFTSFPGSFFFVLYNIIFRPITFFYYAYDTYLVNKKCKELKNMEPDDENRDKLLKDTLFLLTQMNNDDGDKLNCLFYTKSKKYGQIFQYQIDNGIDAMVKNLPIAKAIAKNIEDDIAQVENFGQLSALLLKHSSELTNKFNIEPNKVIKVSWQDTVDDKGKDIRKFTIENVDAADMVKNDNNLYIDNPAIKHLFKTMADNNRSAKEDSDFGRDMKSIVDSYESALSDKNLNITNEILNTKITTEDIGEFQQSIDTLIENIEKYCIENKDDFNKIGHINQYMSTVETHLDSVKEGPQKQIDDLKNKIESYYSGMFKTLYIQAEKILDYNKDSAEHTLKEGLDSTDSYKDNIRRINHVIVHNTKYQDIIEFANEFMKPNKKAIDHISTGNMDLKTYEVYAKQIKGIIEDKKIAIAAIKADIAHKYNILYDENNKDYNNSKEDMELERRNNAAWSTTIANNPGAANEKHTKVIYVNKDDQGGKSGKSI